MEPNPYSVPVANPFGSSSATTDQGLTEGVLRQLKGTKGWVKLMAVISFLLGGMMCLGGLAVAVFGIFGSTLLATIGAGGDEMAGLTGLGGAIGGVVIGVVYAGLGAIYLIPGFKLWGYASSIEDLLKDHAVVTLEKALDYQRAFWKFVGLFTIVMIALYLLAIVAIVIFGGIAAVTAAGAAGAGL
jgi:hypothetical protein